MVCYTQIIHQLFKNGIPTTEDKAKKKKIVFIKREDKAKRNIKMRRQHQHIVRTKKKKKELIPQVKRKCSH